MKRIVRESSEVEKHKAMIVEFLRENPNSKMMSIYKLCKKYAHSTTSNMVQSLLQSNTICSSGTGNRRLYSVPSIKSDVALMMMKTPFDKIGVTIKKPPE